MLKPWCIWLCKDTNLKANHNNTLIGLFSLPGVYDSAKILIWKQITTKTRTRAFESWCIWLCKDTNLKANHNYRKSFECWSIGVYDSAKILIWKQITTTFFYYSSCKRCIWLCKDTNLKANHNNGALQMFQNNGVYDSAKILIWKQITTTVLLGFSAHTVYMTLQRY